MPDLIVQPDVLGLLIEEVLLPAPELQAIVGANIGTRNPEGAAYPILRVQRLGGRQAMRNPLWLDGARIQVDAWGTTDEEAHDLAATAEAVLFAALGHSSALGVITDVEELIGRRQIEDPGTNTHPRYVFELRVTVHPPN
jgi:hypothetical protein